MWPRSQPWIRSRQSGSSHFCASVLPQPGSDPGCACTLECLLHSLHALDPASTSHRDQVGALPPFVTLSRVRSPTTGVRPRSWLLGSVADRFDVVAVRIDDEGRVVVLVDVAPDAWRSVVHGPTRHSGLVERVDA